VKRRDFSRCVIGLAAPDCLCGACRYYERERGCQYEAPEPVGKLGLRPRRLPAAVEPARPAPEEAA
jgi:hypothetical protein